MNDHDWMGECLRLARKGEGNVSPNPLVGSVLVRKGRVLSSGFHRFYGGLHAEAECLSRCREPAAGATLYVNLEPCHHTGKTGPCTEAIISRGIRTVVVGMKDPNPLVRGKGIARLRRAGVHVTVGVREAECRDLNRAFIKHMTTGYPYIHMKVASSIDGKLAGKDRWLTSSASRRLVHRWRGTHDAVLVGAGTVIADNPRLTVRSVPGRDPHVVVIDGNFRSPLGAAVFKAGRASERFLCISKRASERCPRKLRAFRKRGITVLIFGELHDGISFRRLFRALVRQGLASILVEAGADLSGRLLRSGVVDRLSLFLAPSVLGGSVHGFQSAESSAFISNFTLESTRKTGTDLLLIYTRR